MKLEVQVTLNLKVKEVTEAVRKAARLGLRDTIVGIHNDAVKLCIWKTAHNRRSIASEVSGMGVVKQGPDAEPERVVDDSKLEAAVYSTSGYGGYIEIGTGIYGPSGQPITPKTKPFLAWQDKSGEWIFAKSVRGMPAHPYFRPALDMHSNELAPNIKRRLEGS